MPVVVSRRVHFNAAHRLWNNRWSEAENARVFGVCSNPNFHGHNYNLDVSITGDINPDTGYVMDINKLKQIVEECLVRHLDHKNLNLDVPWFKDMNPTTENMVIVAWGILEPAVRPARLVRIRLWETERNYVDYDGT